MLLQHSEMPPKQRIELSLLDRTCATTRQLGICGYWFMNRKMVQNSVLSLKTSLLILLCCSGRVVAKAISAAGHSTGGLMKLVKHRDETITLILSRVEHEWSTAAPAAIRGGKHHKSDQNGQILNSKMQNESQ